MVLAPRVFADLVDSTAAAQAEDMLAGDRKAAGTWAVDKQGDIVAEVGKLGTADTQVVVE